MRSGLPASLVLLAAQLRLAIGDVDVQLHCRGQNAISIPNCRRASPTGRRTFTRPRRIGNRLPHHEQPTLNSSQHTRVPYLGGAVDDRLAFQRRHVVRNLRGVRPASQISACWDNFLHQILHCETMPEGRAITRLLTRQHCASSNTYAAAAAYRLPQTGRAARLLSRILTGCA